MLGVELWSRTELRFKCQQCHVPPVKPRANPGTGFLLCTGEGVTARVPGVIGSLMLSCSISEPLHVSLPRTQVLGKGCHKCSDQGLRTPTPKPSSHSSLAHPSPAPHPAAA